MKAIKIIYWITTGLIVLGMLANVYNYFFNPALKVAFAHLGFPDWFRVELGTAKLLGAVVVSFVPDHLWFVNSVSLAELKTKSFHLNIKISDSTNLKVDKADYINVVHKSLNSLLGDIHPVSYTAIQETKADAYGYEGITIEYKYINNQRKNDSASAQVV